LLEMRGQANSFELPRALSLIIQNWIHRIASAEMAMTQDAWICLYGDQCASIVGGSRMEMQGSTLRSRGSCLGAGKTSFKNAGIRAQAGNHPGCRRIVGGEAFRLAIVDRRSMESAMKKLDAKTLRAVSGGSLIKIGNPTITIAPQGTLLSTAAKVS
jgi:hypothetical protein